MSGAFRNVVVGMDLSSGGERLTDAPLTPAGAAALEAARRFAGRGSRVRLLSALDLDPLAASLLRARKVRPEVLARARERLEALAAPLAKAGCRVSAEAVIGRPADALLADATANGRDLVIVGTRERGAVARNLLGSTSLRLLRRSPVAVWVARPGKWRKKATVLAAIDLGDMAPRILAAAHAVAAAAKAELQILHVVDFAAADVLRAGAADEEVVLEFRRRKREAAEEAVPALVARTLGKRARVRIRLVDGDVAPAIAQCAEETGAELVVAGSVVHSAAGALFGLGRTAEAVLPVLRASLLVLKP